MKLTMSPPLNSQVTIISAECGHNVACSNVLSQETAVHRSEPDDVVGFHRHAHQLATEALRRAALDLAVDRLRVQRPADILRCADPHHAGQAELDVDLDDDP